MRITTSFDSKENLNPQENFDKDFEVLSRVKYSTLDLKWSREGDVAVCEFHSPDEIINFLVAGLQDRGVLPKDFDYHVVRSYEKGSPEWICLHYDVDNADSDNQPATLRLPLIFLKSRELRDLAAYQTQQSAPGAETQLNLLQ